MLPGYLANEGRQSGSSREILLWFPCRRMRRCGRYTDCGLCAGSNVLRRTSTGEEDAHKLVGRERYRTGIARRLKERIESQCFTRRCMKIVLSCSLHCKFSFEQVSEVILLLQPGKNLVTWQREFHLQPHSEIHKYLVTSTSNLSPNTNISLLFNKTKVGIKLTHLPDNISKHSTSSIIRISKSNHVCCCCTQGHL
jgi:hypothetical protein